ncbi:Eukaryotic translation initiation factor 5A [Gryganskiella cystojenkinii]|nr:Eukaryotic translation initiation factor 5A [Gryganskiella cystojenkinii]
MAQHLTDSQNDPSTPTYEIETQSLKKGDYCILDDRPYRIWEVSWSKMGKVGHPKVCYLAFDLITDGQQHLRLLPVSDEEDQEINDNVLLPKNAIGEKIKADFENDKQLIIIVHSILGYEGVFSFREDS